MDVLSDVFVSLQLKRGSYTQLELSEPWGLEFRGYDHSDFGVVTRGTCFLTTEDHPTPVQLGIGDCWVLPRGDTHELRSGTGITPVPFSEVKSRKSANVFRYGGSGAPTTIVAGNFVFEEHSARWLTDLLPALMVFRSDQAAPAGLLKTLLMLRHELERKEVGSTIIISRLVDILFVQTVRAHISAEAQSTLGWVRALSDHRIARAVKSMHGKIDGTWTVEALSAVAGMSRAAFATHFKQVVGEPPMEYLTKLRMQRAAQMLTRRGSKVAAVGVDVGYMSESAFNKAFKRITGVAPGRWNDSVGVLDS